MEPRNSRREEQAEREVGHSTVRPVVAAFLTLFFLLAVTLPPLWELFHHAAKQDPAAFRPLVELLRLPPRGAEFSEAISERGLLRGAATLNGESLVRMERFEARLQNESPLRALVLAPVNRGLGGWLGASNSNVFPGEGDWLFYGPALRHITGPDFVAPASDKGPVAALLDFQQQLAERDIDLVVLPVPGKASIYPERLDASLDGSVPRHNGGYARFLHQLRDGGVDVFDPTAILMDAKAEGPAYLDQDSHWSPSGMTRVAQGLAAHIEERVPLPATGVRGYGWAPETTLRAPGDLARMRCPGPEGMGDIGESVAIRPVRDPEGNPWTPDPESAVLLLGDSFTNIYSRDDLGWGAGAGLAEQLSYFLGRPVDRIARNDGGAHATRRALSDALARGEDRLAHTRVVVYQFAARELSWGDWKMDLPLRLEGPAVNEATAGITVQGRLRAISRPPAPGTVPYKDCIVSLLLEPDGESGLAGPLLIYAWGMRDHRWTAVAQWQVGESVSVALTPWAQVAGDLDSINQISLEGDHTRSLPIWWMEGEPDLADPAPPTRGRAVVPESGEGDPGLHGLVQQLEAKEEMVLPGREGWLHFTPELRSLAAGPFWGERAPQVSRAAPPRFADPLPAILDFHRQLAAAGIELIVMPVPPKAGIYPEGVTGENTARDLREAMADDGPLASFLALLREGGITAIDLRDLFLGSRDEGPPLYCQTDTHWSPRGAALAAQAAAEVLQDRPWHGEITHTAYATEETTITFRGDLAALAGDDVPEETLPLMRVGTREGGELVPIAPHRDSPVLLIGDSHALVFHAGGDMHGSAGGLPDHLALALGMPADLVAVRGSGATTPRINLARRQDKLAGKRVVLWCFSAREFTESATGWRPVQVLP